MSPTTAQTQQLTTEVTEVTSFEEFRVAELVARTGLEPDLADRYATDPVSVLAEFGISAVEPMSVELPGTGPVQGGDFLEIEDINAFYRPVGCACAMPTAPVGHR